MRYVQRDPDTKLVIGSFANLQKGYAEEKLADDHADLLVFEHQRAVARAAIEEQSLQKRIPHLEATVAAQNVTIADLTRRVAALERRGSA